MSIKDNLIYQWIMNNKKAQRGAGKLIDELKFVSFPYDKYGETVFAMKQGGWNVPLIENVSRDLHDGTRKGYEDTREFAEYLAKRMELCLNYFHGKSNEEIEQLTQGGDDAKK